MVLRVTFNIHLESETCLITYKPTNFEHKGDNGDRKVRFES